MSPSMFFIFLILFFLFFVSFSPLQPSLFCLLFFFFYLDLLPPSHEFSLMSSPFFYTSPFFCSSPFHLLHFFLGQFLFFPYFAPPTHSKSPPLPLKYGKVEKWVWGDPMSPHYVFYFYDFIFIIFLFFVSFSPLQDSLFCLLFFFFF